MVDEIEAVSLYVIDSEKTRICFRLILSFQWRSINIIHASCFNDVYSNNEDINISAINIKFDFKTFVILYKLKNEKKNANPEAINRNLF